MSETPPSILDQVKTPSLESFRNLDFQDIKKEVSTTDIVESPVAKQEFNLYPEQIKIDEAEINEIVKSVVVQAKFQSERTDIKLNPETVDSYNQVVDSAVERGIISSQELNSRVDVLQQEQIEKNAVKAEGVIEDAYRQVAIIEILVKNTENLTSEDVAKVYIARLSLMDFNNQRLDNKTRDRLTSAIQKVDNAIQLIESEIIGGESESSFSILKPILNLVKI